MTRGKLWYEPSKPEDIKATPWLHKDAIAYFGSILRPDFHVFEHGCGGSTLWLAKRVADVVSVDDNPEWARAVAAHKLTNVRIILSDAIPNLGRKYDLVFIDGPVRTRGKFLAACRGIIKPGGWIVLDNANNPKWAKERAALSAYAKLIESFDAGMEHLVTEFWRVNE